MVTAARYNFNAGPAMLPSEVLQEVQAELLNWQGLGVSVMEVSHRSAEFVALMESAKQDLRDLLAIPDGYSVLFLQGGASLQFSQIPMNLLQTNTPACYLDTGHWSKKAIKEAGKLTELHVVEGLSRSEDIGVKSAQELSLPASAAYFHYTSNETIDGIRFPFVPEVGESPLVCDMSSDFLAYPVDVNRFGLIYAGAQKNVGPAGLVLVIIRNDLLERSSTELPSSLSYASQAKANSMLNTPPTFACYVAAKVFAWLKKKGGLEAMGKRNEEKAARLYDYIDSAAFYRNPVAPESRSLMNVPFVLSKPELDESFLSQAQAAGLMGLKGHRSVGGMRASIYNAMPADGVDALIDFMQNFAASNSRP